MVNRGCGQNYCAYGVKFFVALCGSTGIVFSILGANSCEFISFIDTNGNPSDMAEHPPFDTAIAGSVGIFRYSITEGIDGLPPVSDGCVSYQVMFAQQTGYPTLATAQYCTAISPLLAAIGIFANLVDLCVCNFVGSFVIGSLTFLAASAISGGAFALLADPTFCLEDTELKCSVGNGVYYIVGSTIFYLISGLFLFCSPPSDPFCYNFGCRKKNYRT